MPHRCIKCGSIYGDVVLECECGARAFVFTKDSGPAHIVPEGDGKYRIVIDGLFDAACPGEIRRRDGLYEVDVERLLKKD